MKRGILWLSLSCLMIAAMLLSSCKTTPTATTVTTTTTATTTTTSTTAATTTTSTAAGPKYGGIIKIIHEGDVTGFDPWSYGTYYWPINMNTDHLSLGDWNLTKDQWGCEGIYIPVQFAAPSLAESWEQTSPTTITVHLRHGVRFNAGLPEMKALLGDREVVGKDVKYSAERCAGVGEFAGKPSAVVQTIWGLLSSVTVDPSDKYSVTFTFKSPNGSELLTVVGLFVYPREVVDKYGDYNDWKHYCGSGPFIITDRVPGASLTYKRNPAYWGTSATYGEDYPIPFVDGVDQLVITDTATQLSALRTGKLDLLESVDWKQADSLAKTNPELISRKVYSGTNLMVWGSSSPHFQDVRVRQALVMAINHQEMVTTYYKDNAKMGAWPMAPDWVGYYIPYEDMSTTSVAGTGVSLKEMYTYNVTKAKELLTAAGYPTGFATEVILPNIDYPLIDEWQVIKSYWALIGVNLTIKPLDGTTYVLTAWFHKAPELASQGAGQADPNTMLGWCVIPSKGYYSGYNFTDFYDPAYNAKYDAITKSTDPIEQKRLINELTTYYMELAIMAPLPTPVKYTYWQPWLKGGYWGQCKTYRGGQLCKEVWLDQELKAAMGK